MERSIEEEEATLTTQSAIVLQSTNTNDISQVLPQYNSQPLTYTIPHPFPLHTPPTNTLVMQASVTFDLMLRTCNLQSPS